MSLSNLSISAKLFVLAGALVTGLLAVGGYGLQALSQAQERQHAALERKRAVLEAVDLARGTEVAFKLQVQEWKDILIRGHDPADQERYLAAFRKAADKTVASLEKVERAVSGLGLSTDEVQEARRMHAALLRDYLNAFQQYSTERIDSTQTVDRLVRGKDRPLDAAIEKVVTGIGRFAVQDSEQLTAAAAADTRRAVVAMLIVIALVLAIAASLALWVGRDIARPLREAVVAAQQVAGGDLTVQLRTGRRDEVGQMLMAFAAMTASLEALIREVGTGSLAVAESSAQIAQGHIDLSQRTEEQAATLEETASQMEELTTTVLQNADHARQAGEFASGAAVVARKGGDEVSRVVSTMAEISKASRRIHEITSLIDEIAFQTNILALNAAVEAARAGEQGRGFAVVAAEVRSLAQRSATAAREIKGLVGASVDKVDAGTKLADSAGRTIQEVTDSVRRMADLVQDIAAASREQGVGIEQVNTAVTQMDQVVQQNAALVEEAAAATESMKEQAASLLAVISRFKLRDLHGGARVAPVQAAPSRGAPGSIPALAGAGGWPDLI